MDPRSDEDHRASLIAASLCDFADKPLRLIGLGHMGAAASLGDGRVLKLTTDPMEVTAAKALVGHRVPNVADLFEIQALPCQTFNGFIGKEMPIHWVILEELEPPKWSLRNKELLDLFSLVEKVRALYKTEHVDIIRDPTDEKQASMKQASLHLLEILSQKKGPALEIHSALQALQNMGLYPVDVHGYNVGWSSSEKAWKLFDVTVFPGR